MCRADSSSAPIIHWRFNMRKLTHTLMLKHDSRGTSRDPWSSSTHLLGRRFLGMLSQIRDHLTAARLYTRAMAPAHVMMPAWPPSHVKRITRCASLPAPSTGARVSADRIKVEPTAIRVATSGITDDRCIIPGSYAWPTDLPSSSNKACPRPCCAIPPG